MTKNAKRVSRLIGPPRTASNQYVYDRMRGNCIECECCGGQWHYRGEKKAGVSMQVNIAGRVMATRRAMYLAANPGKIIQNGRRISSKCENENCVNPRLLFQSTASDLLKSHYTKGIRSRAEAAAHLNRYIEGRLKLTEEDAAQIRNDDRKGAEAAHEWGISKEHYNAIQRGDARKARASNPFAGLGART